MHADSDSISYAVWVTGFLDGTDPEDCRRKVAAVFGTPAEKIDQLFRSMPCQVKDQLDEASARRYAAAFELVGLRSEVRQSQASVDEAGAPAAQPTAHARIRRLGETLRPAARHVLPAMLVLGLLAAGASLLPAAWWHKARPSPTAGGERADFAALQLGPLAPEEQQLLTRVRAAHRVSRSAIPLFDGVLLDVSHAGSAPPVCRIDLSPRDGAGQPVPAWFSLGVRPAQGQDAARLAVARYFLKDSAPTLVVDGRQVPLGEGLTPQTAGVAAGLELMRELLGARTVQVRFGRDASGEVTYAYDVRRLASALRIAREACGVAAASAGTAS